MEKLLLSNSAPLSKAVMLSGVKDLECLCQPASITSWFAPQILTSYLFQTRFLDLLEKLVVLGLKESKSKSLVRRCGLNHSISPFYCSSNENRKPDMIWGIIHVQST